MASLFPVDSYATNFTWGPTMFQALLRAGVPQDTIDKKLVGFAFFRKEWRLQAKDRFQTDFVSEREKRRPRRTLLLGTDTEGPQSRLREAGRQQR